MQIAHVSPWRLPVRGYGGSQRVLTWLVRAQVDRGDQVTVFAPPGTRLPGARVIPLPGALGSKETADCLRDAAAGADVIHWQQFPQNPIVDRPWVSTVHGNSPGELEFHPNKIYVSRSHAKRAGSSAFVHNGLDPAEYVFRESKDDYILFLSKVSRKSKGVDTALRLAHELGFRLVVAGGSRWDLLKTGGWWNSWRTHVEFVGEVDGARKAELLANARALLFPIRWPEPFGLVVIEALVSGTPVITAPLGAMPEIVTPEVGFLCTTMEDYRRAIARVEGISPFACRQRVLQAFTHHHMAAAYEPHYLHAIARWREQASTQSNGTGVVAR